MPATWTDFSAEKISNHVYVIHGPLELPNETNEGFMNNPAFIVTDDGVVVIDPGSSVHTGNMLLREIRKVTELPVIAVFDTHVHGDHWLGNDAIKRAILMQISMHTIKPFQWSTTAKDRTGWT